MISNNKSHHQLRRTYFVGVIITILLGLASRKFGYLLFSFLAENAGDVLWAMMVYFGFRFLFLKKNMLTSILLSFLFSFGIKFSPLYQENWINQIRGTLLGALVLGKGFLTVDLIRYTTGIVIASCLDCLIIPKKQKNI
jgi:ABC-type Mn2+/Zn2+ transport system permease subunit